MRKTANKLVRDRIPEIIRADGRKCSTVILDAAEYRKALLQKLVEEAHEAASCEPSALECELADVLEVVDAMVSAFQLDWKRLGEERQRRRAERGAFADRVKLLWFEVGV